jgi:hypothetical protein
MADFRQSNRQKHLTTSNAIIASHVQQAIFAYVRAHIQKSRHANATYEHFPTSPSMPIPITNAALYNIVERENQEHFRCHFRISPKLGSVLLVSEPPIGF